MSLLAAIRKLWRFVVPRTQSDVEKEFRSTIDAHQEDLIRRCFSKEEARKARIDLGQPAPQNETYRAAIALRLFDELGGDIRYSLRAMGPTLPASLRRTSAGRYMKPPPTLSSRAKEHDAFFASCSAVEGPCVSADKLAHPFDQPSYRPPHPWRESLP